MFKHSPRRKGQRERGNIPRNWALWKLSPVLIPRHLCVWWYGVGVSVFNWEGEEVSGTDHVRVWGLSDLLSPWLEGRREGESGMNCCVGPLPLECISAKLPAGTSAWAPSGLESPHALILRLLPRDTHTAHRGFEHFRQRFSTPDTCSPSSQAIQTSVPLQVVSIILHNFIKGVMKAYTWVFYTMVVH